MGGTLFIDRVEAESVWLWLMVFFGNGGGVLDWLGNLDDWLFNWSGDLDDWLFNWSSDVLDDLLSWLDVLDELLWLLNVLDVLDNWLGLLVDGWGDKSLDEWLSNRVGVLDDWLSGKSLNLDDWLSLDQLWLSNGKNTCVWLKSLDSIQSDDLFGTGGG